MADAIRPPIDFGHREEAYQTRSQRPRTEKAPTGSLRLGPLTVVCLVLNRTIGSGIFVGPALVLGGVGSVGGALLVWTLGGLIMTCGALLWLELGLSCPLAEIPGVGERPIPRSGGDKNYLEFIYRNPRTKKTSYLVTCMYGIPYIAVGNLTGNAIAFGIFVMRAATGNVSKGPVLGLAIGALTLAVGLHMFSRQVGIYTNNAFACLKVAILLAVSILGFMKAGGVSLGGGPQTATSNFDPHNAFAPPPLEVSSFASSLVFVLYTFSGFQQPFYVLAEVKRPRKTFPKYVLLAMAIALTLFLLVNAAYFCAVPRDSTELLTQRNMATVFFSDIFGNDTAIRVMDAVIAFSIFGNLLVATYTGPRVKQEIAKEGILPWSLVFATSHTTPLAYLLNSGKARGDKPTQEDLEQTPMAALSLHWFTSMFLLAVTAMLDVNIAYSVLVTLYSYVVVVLNGFFLAVGLLYLKLNKNRNWSHPNYKPWGSTVYAVIFAIACAFVLIVAFVPPSSGSPYAYAATGIQWYIVPTIGLTAPLWGVIWAGGLWIVEHWIRGRKLVVTRDMTTAEDEVRGQYVMVSEEITHGWPLISSGDRDSIDLG